MHNRGNSCGTRIKKSKLPDGALIFARLEMLLMFENEGSNQIEENGGTKSDERQIDETEANTLRLDAHLVS